MLNRGRVGGWIEEICRRIVREGREREGRDGSIKRGESVEVKIVIKREKSQNKKRKRT